MPKRFCQECGLATDFAAVRPSFCSHCGKNFNGGTKPVIASRTRSEDTDDEEEEETSTGQPIEFDLTDLGVEIVIPASARQKVTVADIAQTKGSGGDLARAIPARVNKKNVLDELLPLRNAKRSPVNNRRRK